MRRAAPAALTFACLAALTFACYGRVLLRGEQPAYRDAGHYYYPLDRRVQQEWSAGRWPLWEPNENAGAPLLANPTAAALYPGKLVFAVLPYPAAARAYVVLHSLLAFAATAALLRSWRAGPVASALAASSYAFGGPVLFQSCNVVYLVGASWAPLGLLAADRWVRLRRRPALLGLAAVLSLQTLGGDPESAYVTGLCAAGYALLPLASRRGVKTLLAALVPAWVGAVLAAAAWRFSLPDGWAGPLVLGGWTFGSFVLVALWRRARRRGEPAPAATALAGLAGAAALAAALSAAQLLPSAEFARLSSRGEHEIYSFSLEPPRVAELVWPNVFGSPLPENHSWLPALRPGDEPARLWVHSLYLGALTVPLAFAAAGRPGAHPARPWLISVAALGLLASFGEYAGPLGWARRWPAASAWLGPHDPPGAAGPRADGRPRDGDGGPYGAMAALLPGFRLFRYPSKLLTFHALAMAALAGFGWDDLASGARGGRRRLAACSAALLGLTLAALAVSGPLGERLLRPLDGRPEESFGPFDAAGALAELRLGLAQGGLVLAAALGLALRARPPGLAASALALALATADLALANAGQVVSAPQRLFDEPSAALEAIRRAEAADPTPGPFRVHRPALWEPSAWATTRSPRRPEEFVAWERATLQPRYGTPLGVSYTTTSGAAEVADHRAFFEPYLGSLGPVRAARLGVPAGRDLVLHRRRAFDLWNTRYFVLPFRPGGWASRYRSFASFLEGTEPVLPGPGRFAGPDGPARRREWAETADYQVRRNLSWLPRAWVVHDARVLPPESAGRDARLDELLFSGAEREFDPSRPVFDPRRVVWVEPGDRAALAPFVAGGEPSPGESVRVTALEPDRVALSATLERPGVVVLSDLDYPGWSLTVDGAPARPFRVNAAMRGAAVPAGVHGLEYRYRPASFRAGLAVSCAALAACLALAAAAALRPPGRTGSPNFHKSFCI